MKAYAISGLGADKRVFDYLNINATIIPLDWIKPERKETIQSYALRLSKKIDTTIDFMILGVSFGGLIAVELSKILNPKQTIIISSVETKSELRLIYRFLGRIRILNSFPKALYNPPRKIAIWLFGTKKKELLSSIFDDTNLEFAKWAVNQLLAWENETKIDNIVKISGSKDKLMPPKRNKNFHLIEDGAHLMIVDLAPLVSETINKYLKNKTDD